MAAHILRSIALAGLACLVSGVMPPAASAKPTTAPATRPAERRPTVDAALRKGVEYLLKSQTKEGAWGTGRETRGFEIVAAVPGSLKSFQVATTALCVMALREAGESGQDPRVWAAHKKGLEFLVNNADVRRDNGALLYNVWAHTYGLQCLAIEARHSPDPRIVKAAQEHLRKLGGYQTFMGGWDYYDFDVGARAPAANPTSFGSAAALVALLEARESKLDVPQPMVDRALKRLEQMRLPNHAYLYSYDLRYIPRLDANQPRGSVGRTQACNYALWVWGRAKVDAPQARDGLDFFFREHAYIRMGQKRPMPHESWYQTAPYYYYFGHYYAARLVEKLGHDGKKAYGAKLADVGILPYQGAEGAWWDYAMWDFHKPYGTAFAVMTLLRCE